MSTEARVVAPQQKIGARPTGGAAGDGDAPTGKGKSKKLTMIIGLVILVAAGAAYWFLMGPGAAADEAVEGAEAEPEYELGEVAILDSISINLEGGHYLRLGLGIQQVASDGGGHGGGTEFEAAKALDAAIALFSGESQEALADPHYREELKEQLEETLYELYHHEVVGVYYTDFVTQ